MLDDATFLSGSEPLYDKAGDYMIDWSLPTNIQAAIIQWCCRDFPRRGQFWGKSQGRKLPITQHTNHNQNSWLWWTKVVVLSVKKPIGYLRSFLLPWQLRPFLYPFKQDFLFEKVLIVSQCEKNEQTDIERAYCLTPGQPLSKFWMFTKTASGCSLPLFKQWKWGDFKVSVRQSNKLFS